MFTGFFKTKLERLENVIINFILTLTLVLIVLEVMGYTIPLPLGAFFPLVVSLGIWTFVFVILKFIEKYLER